MVRNMRAVLKKASWGTRRISEAFGVKNRRFRYRRDIRCAEQPSVVRDASGYSVSAHPLWYGTDHSVLKKAITETTQKKDKSCDLSFFSSGGWTRTNDLRVMSPTSYQLLYPAMFGNTKVGISFEFTKFFSLFIANTPLSSAIPARSKIILRRRGTEPLTRNHLWQKSTVARIRGF